MFAYRLIGLFLVASLLVVAGVSAQPGLPPGVKVQPNIKPNVPKAPNPPKGGDPKAPDPKGKNPVPPVGMNPGGGLPGVPAVPSPPPPAKKDNIKWPTEVGGKTLEVTLKDMRTHSDPAIREAAVRALPAFGPKGRELGATLLIEAMTRDLDWNVRFAAMHVAPTVLLGFAEGPDPALNNGLTALNNFLSHEFMHVRAEAIGIVSSIGPYMRKAQPTVIQKLIANARISSSWQMRRAAVAAIANVGHGEQTGENPATYASPDPQSVTGLLDILKSDNCAVVRREAVNSLIALGPVAAEQQKTWKSSVDNVFRLNIEKDKSVLLWTRVLIIRNSPKGLEGNEAHLDAIAKTLEAVEPGGRLEACGALGSLGEEAKSKLQNLIDVINNAKEEPEIVAAAIMAATAMPSKSAVTVPILVNVKATHKSKDVQAVAGEAIDILTGKKKN